MTATTTTTTPTDTPLSTSLIHYVFFPLTQLLRNLPLGVASLPDRAREHVFVVLECLARDWYQAWIDDGGPKASTMAKQKEKWQVWEQLLVLGATALGGPPSESRAKKEKGATSSSDETLAAVTAFLESLLIARICPALRSPASDLKEKEEEWEWDGESELPSLDDYDTKEATSTTAATVNGDAHMDHSQQSFPSKAHLDFTQESKTSKGALAHALTAALDIACSTDATAPRDYVPSLRTACLRLARIILWTWIAGSTERNEDLLVTISQVPTSLPYNEEIPSQDRRKTQAQRAAVFLPGFVSSLTRLLSTHRGRHDESEGLNGNGTAPMSKRTLPGHLAAEALDALRDILGLCVDDGVAIQILPDNHLSTLKRVDGGDSSLTVLEDLVADASLDDKSRHQRVLAIEGVSNAEAQADKVEGINEAWLRDTMIRIHVALVTISPTAQHSHALAQLALVRLAGYMLFECFLASSLELRRDNGSSDPDDTDIAGLLLVWILDLAASPGVSTNVQSQAIQELVRLIASQEDKNDAQRRQIRCKLLDDILETTLRRLPRVIHGQKDEAVTHLAHRLTFLMELLSGGIGGQPLRPSAGLLSLIRPATVDGARGWDHSSWLDIVQVDEQDVQEVAGNLRPRLTNLDALASGAILDALRELGRGCGRILLIGDGLVEDTTAVIQLFFREAARTRTSRGPTSAKMVGSRSTSVSATVIADEMLRGLAEILDDAKTSNIVGREGKRIRKAAHRLAKTVIRQIIDVWEADQEEMLSINDAVGRKTDGDKAAGQSIGDVTRREEEQEYRDNVVIEHHKKGARAEGNREEVRDLQGFGPALDLSSVTSDSLSLLDKAGPASKAVIVENAQIKAASSLRRGDAALLSMLGSAATLLGPLIRSSLLPILYPVISAVAASSPLVQSAAAEAMQRIAHSAVYASVEGCILDHADYILGAASHRLVASLGVELEALASFSLTDPVKPPSTAMTTTSLAKKTRHDPLTSAQSAPLVLVEVIRMLGPEAVPLVEDAVDEVLDALDRFHGFDELCDGLLQVMDRLIEVMAPQPRSSAGEKKRKGRGLGTRPSSTRPWANVQSDLDDFEQWFKTRKDRPKISEDEGKAFDEIMDEVEQKQAGKSGNDEDGEAGDPPMTRSQAVVGSIMSKAIPFLSHASPIIRARCLGLLARGVAILGPQDRPVELLAAVERAWPLIMARLGFSKSRPLPLSTAPLAALDEQEPFVWTEALKLVGELAKHLSEFLGPRKLIDEAWQRISRLLKHVEALVPTARPRVGASEANQPKTYLLHPSSASSNVAQTSATGATAKGALVKKATAAKGDLVIWPAYGPYTTFLCSAMSVLCTLIDALGCEQASLQTSHALSIALHPTLLDCADRRQPINVREATGKLYQSLATYNADLVWFVVVDQQQAQSKGTDGKYRDIWWLLETLKL